MKKDDTLRNILKPPENPRLVVDPVKAAELPGQPLKGPLYDFVIDSSKSTDSIPFEREQRFEDFLAKWGKVIEEACAVKDRDSGGNRENRCDGMGKGHEPPAAPQPEPKHERNGREM